jgi:hypothetical protein
MPNGKIFISYRREDTSGESGRLKDKLEQVFGQENIFYDVETLEAGLNFDQSIDKALSESKVLLAMIGPHWLKASDGKGELRLQKPGDWVRKEIAASLKRGLRVIPVLVNGAAMPDSADLPEELQELSLKHAQEISSSRWNYDVGELIKVLEKIIDKKPEPKPQPVPEPKPNPRPYVAPIPQPKSWWTKNYLWVLGGIVGFILLVVIFSPKTEESYTEDSTLTEEPYSETNPTDPTTQNPEGNEIYNSLQLDEQNSSSSKSQEINPIVDLTGYWILRDYQGNQSTLYFAQNGNRFEFVEYNLLNVQIGQGEGEIVENQMNSGYYNSLFEVNGQITMITRDNGRSWEGQVSIPSANTSSQITLTRN